MTPLKRGGRGATLTKASKTDFPIHEMSSEIKTSANMVRIRDMYPFILFWYFLEEAVQKKVYAKAMWMATRK